jgi:hypothetical protein
VELSLTITDDHGERSAWMGDEQSYNPTVARDMAVVAIDTLLRAEVQLRFLDERAGGETPLP